MKRLNVRGGIEQQNIILVIIIALVFVLFLTGMAQRSDSRAVKQEVLEKQIALFVDSVDVNVNLTVRRQNVNGYVQDIIVKDNRVYVTVNDLVSIKGYPFFSEHDVTVHEGDDDFILEVKR
jgi:hypothetical protein